MEIRQFNSKYLPGVYHLADFWDCIDTPRGNIHGFDSSCFWSNDWDHYYEYPILKLKDTKDFKIAFAIFNSSQLLTIGEDRLEKIGFKRPFEGVSNGNYIHLFYLTNNTPPEERKYPSARGAGVNFYQNWFDDSLMNSTGTFGLGDPFCCGAVWKIKTVEKTERGHLHPIVMSFFRKKDIEENDPDLTLLKKRGYVTDLFPDFSEEFTVFFSSRHNQVKTNPVKELF